MIAIDAMGGDFAPDAVLEGVVSCAKSSKIKICLFGPRGDLEKKLAKLDSAWEKLQISIIDAPEIIEMGEEPVRAVKKKRNSSLVKAVELVASGQCKAIVSAGNSGAVMIASLLLIGRKKGVERPALIGFVPAIEKPVLCLDLGANADCKAEHLYQFAHMGVEYAKETLGAQNPSVGLLSNGEEPKKGSLVTKGAFSMLEKSGLNFIGNVEPCHVLQNKADIVVSDGFSGNIMLKTLEAVASLMLKNKCRLDDQGGALLLGVKKTVIIVHGSALPDNIERAIKHADFSGY